MENEPNQLKTKGKNKMANKIIILHNNPGQVLRRQKEIDQHNLPHTLNATIGCHFGCIYCYTQTFPFKRHAEFGKEVKVKTWLPDRLDIELEKYKYLPQHLKRVQVNPSTESYLPSVMIFMKKKYGRDLMLEILQIFKKHWEAGNHWMVHLITKSHMILKHLDVLSEMKHQVQVELTLTTLSEERKKILEGTASSVKRRLEVIRSLSKAGVFVRVMCMPFIGSRSDAAELRHVCFDMGATAFKHKSTNYWDESELLNGKLKKVKGRKDFAYEDLLLNSGEPLEKSGQLKRKNMIMPTKKWDNWIWKSMPMENLGYSKMNEIDWGYMK